MKVLFYKEFSLTWNKDQNKEILCTVFSCTIKFVFSYPYIKVISIIIQYFTLLSTSLKSKTYVILQQDLINLDYGQNRDIWCAVFL